MSHNTVIKTTKIIYPQIYAYTLPTIQDYNGWVKIGYTERKNVDERIKEQTKTAAINLAYDKLWSEPAKFNTSDDWFKDKQLHTYLRRYKNIEQRTNTEWFFYNGTPEKSHADFNDFRNNERSQVKEKLQYTLRNEQEDAVNMTLDYAKKYKGGEFLWNAKPRFGKTLTTYDFIRKLDASKVLIVTNRPAIANSWFDDFEKFIAWQTDYAFVSTSDSLKDRPVMDRDEFTAQMMDGKNKMLAFISLQDLKGAISFGGSHDKLKWVKDLEWDLLVIDESHEGVDTFKTDIAFENINRNFTLHLSGTPFKAVASGKFSDDQIYNWIYADEQEAKADWPIESEENNPYEKLPRLSLFSYQMSQMITDEVNKGAEIDGENIDYAFDLNEFFETNDTGKFIHEADIKKWLDSLSHNEKYPFSTKELRAELKHTFWLLNRVASAKALEKLLKNHPVFDSYEIILAAGDGRTTDDQIINQKSLDRVRDAIAENDRTITLSVGQLTTGVTVPEWTAVLMLSNMKSPSLYMQAAFRAQNPWEYEVNGEMHQKENAYVFDFAPERTLTIYDEFANNLSRKTSNGGGTTDDRRDNIRTLLNFFPVIAEDNEGKMVELDVNQVLTIPKAIKAQEVVRRGFMSNLLFQNISGIFASAGAREILEQLNPVDQGKTVPRKTDDPIDTKDVKVDDNGEVTVEQDIVVATTEAHFGEKVYADIKATVEKTADDAANNLSNVVATSFKQSTQDAVKELAKENGLTAKAAEQVVQQSANVIAREVETIQRQAEIKHNEAEVEYKSVVAESHSDPIKVAEAKATYEAKKQEIKENFKKEVVATVETKTKELTQKATETVLQKAEEKKKNTVEDDVRARLRGFARTIPSFLMAYGEPTTTLANFDTTITDSVFKEVTGITLDQFRTLRETYNFFDPVVFNESCQEFMRKRQELANYFDESQEEDIFDYIPPQKTNQIFTPKRVVKMMVDKLQEESPEDFRNPDKTFVDLYIKSGLYLTEIVKRLYVGLEDQIPDKDARLKYILENQVYGFAPSEIIYNIARNFIFGFDENAKNIDDSHVVYLDTTPFARGEGDFEAKCDELLGGKDMKFDVVVGNPPYQDNIENRGEQPAIYNFFYDLAEKIGDKYCLISPARFLFNVGSTPKSWNEKMLSDKHIEVVYFNQKASDLFSNTDIKGGVAILYRDSVNTIGPIGTFTSYNELNGIVKKIVKGKFDSIGELLHSNTSYKYTPALWSENQQLKGRVSGGSRRYLSSSVFDKLHEVFYEEKPKDGKEYVQILGRQNNHRIFKWIRRDYLVNHPNIDKFKVLIPSSNGSGHLGEVLSTPIIEEPNQGHTETFISFGTFDNKQEAENLLKYVKTKFARTMLGVVKVTQGNKTKEVWSKVPLQDFTSKSDIDWTQSIPEIDKQLYKKYGLDQKEIAFIEEKVKAMD
mgnify:FL=1